MKNVDRSYIKRMAELLKSGATMLSTSCPNDKVPLFKLKTGEIICPVCNTRFYIVKDEAEHAAVTTSIALESLEQTIMNKIVQINNIISSMDANSVDRNMLESLKLWLEILEKVKSLRKFHS